MEHRFEHCAETGMIAATCSLVKSCCAMQMYGTGEAEGEEIMQEA
jgi:hypothetical protein